MAKDGRRQHEFVLFAGRRFAAWRATASSFQANYLERSLWRLRFPKGDRRRLIVERLVELGIHRMIPLHTAEVLPKGPTVPPARLRRYSIEACKQSGRNRNLEIAEGVNLQSYLQSHTGREANGKSIQSVAHPYPFESQTKEEALSPPERASSLSMIVGPEGGLTDSEVLEAIEAGWQCLNLGPRILRVETAVSYLAALANYWLEPPKILSQG